MGALHTAAQAPSTHVLLALTHQPSLPKAVVYYKGKLYYKLYYTIL